MGDDHDGSRFSEAEGNVNVRVEVVVDGQAICRLSNGGVGNGNGVFAEAVGTRLAQVRQGRHIHISPGTGFGLGLGLNGPIRRPGYS